MLFLSYFYGKLYKDATEQLVSLLKNADRNELFINCEYRHIPVRIEKNLVLN